MSGNHDGRPSSQIIGRFRVSADEDDIRRFERAIAPGDAPLADQEGVPDTFPMSWLGAREVKSAVLAALDGDGSRGEATLVHLEQHIELLTPIQRGGTYDFDVRVEGPDSNSRCRVDAAVIDVENVVVCQLTSILLLVGIGNLPA